MPMNAAFRYLSSYNKTFNQIKWSFFNFINRKVFNFVKLGWYLEIPQMA
jgi:hypothetical protein